MERNTKDFATLGLKLAAEIRRNCPKMPIREFNIADHDEVVRLWKESGLLIRPGDDIDGIRLKLQRDPDLFLVFEDRDEIIGVVMGAWDGRRGWINHLAVKPNRQRAGIGTALVRELERRLILKGARKVNAQIYHWNKKSVDFFRRAGYDVHKDLIMIGKTFQK